MITSCPSEINCLASLSLKVARPPLSGKAGPMMIILLKRYMDRNHETKVLDYGKTQTLF